jgi:hypothetical protein
LLVKRKKVEKECKKHEIQVDNELENNRFMWCRESEYMLFTDDIFGKEKREREEDVIGE